MSRNVTGSEHRGYLIAVASVAGATAVFYIGREDFAKGQWAVLYLLIVGLIAGLRGVRPALTAAVLSFLCWNYFLLPPYYTLRVADPRDYLFLFVFLGAAAVIGLQTGRLRDREAQALAREQEAALLNRFSAHLVSDVSVQEVVKNLVTEVRSVTGAGRVAVVLNDEVVNGGKCIISPDDDTGLTADITQLVSWASERALAVGLPALPSGRQSAGQLWPATASHRDAGADHPKKDMVLPLRTSAHDWGVLYIGEREDMTAYTFHEARMAVALAYQTSVFLDRTHLRTLAVQADALREADRLKSTLISAVSHELKTPLASLEATLSNLLEQDAQLGQEQMREELQAVKQDIDRLAGSIESLLDLSRLEASAWGPRLEWYELGEIIGTALSRLPAQERRRVELAVPSNLPAVLVDFGQWVRVLEHLLRNALAYSDAGSPVRVGASTTSDEVRLWVEDAGPGIAPHERELIFEKFYRGVSAAKAPAGTGLGLAITREIVRFHGGRIWVEDVSPQGARFIITILLDARASK